MTEMQFYKLLVNGQYRQARREMQGDITLTKMYRDYMAGRV